MTQLSFVGNLFINMAYHISLDYPNGTIVLEDFHRRSLSLSWLQFSDTLTKEGFHQPVVHQWGRPEIVALVKT